MSILLHKFNSFSTKPSHVPTRLMLLMFLCSAGTCYADKLTMGPVKITGDSPISISVYKSSCFKQQPVVGTLYRGSEAEPFLAVNPLDSRNMVVAYQLDRFARFGGATTNGASYTTDGGKSWKAVPLNEIPFSRCAAASGGNLGSYQPYERATDPWLAFDKNGTVYLSSLPFDQDYLTGSPGGSIVVTSSTNKGKNWNSINTIEKITGVGNGSSIPDKPSISYDPNGNLYVLFQQYKLNTAGTYLSISSDGGVNWSPTNMIYNPKNDQTPTNKKGYTETGFGNIMVLSDGTLVSVLSQDFGTEFPRVGVIRSTNQGKSWSPDLITIAPQTLTALNDPNGNDQNGNPIPVRSASGNASIAVDKTNDNLYVVWSNLDESSGKFNIYISKSSDKGLTWTPPKKANRSTADAFLPVVGVASNGVVGVFYYDWRNNVAGNNKPLNTDAFLATYDKDLNFRAETRVTTKSFDMRKAPLLNGGGGSLIPGGYFLGDYFGISSIGNDFVLAFIQTTGLGTSGVTPDPNAFLIDPYNRQDVYFAKVSTE